MKYQHIITLSYYHIKMIHPFLENTAKTVQYFMLWIVYALLQTFALYSIVSLPVWLLLTNGLIDAIVFGALGLVLWNVVKFGNFAALTLYQRLVNQIAMALLSISIWLSVGYGLFYLFFGNELSVKLIPVLPTRGLIGLLLYLIIIQHFKNTIQQNQPIKEIHETIVNPEENKSKKVSESEILERIAVKSGTKIHVVLVSEIFYLQADGDYVQIFTATGKYLKEQTMKFFEEHLPENQFVRVHRSVIVNVEMISRIELYEKQNQLLTLKNGQQIKTSPAGYKALRMALNL